MAGPKGSTGPAGGSKSRALRGAAVGSAMLVASAGCSSPQAESPPNGPAAPAVSADDPSELLAVDSSTRAQVVDATAGALRDGYVFPDVGETAAAAIVGHLDDGDYAQLDQGPAFAKRLTDDLQQVTNDQHLRVTFLPPPPTDGPASGFVPPGGPRPGAGPEEIGPGGVTEVAMLEGGVGLIALGEFPPPDPETVAAVAEAMQQVVDAKALVFDLRANHGGHPETVALWCSYLLGSAPVDLITILDRDGSVLQQTATQQVEGPRYTEGEVFVLTSPETFSGGEEFTYNLKHLDRATVVGQATSGGAHLVRPVQLTDTFHLGVPHARPVHAVTGTNWEGTGVTPDVDVPTAKALETAIEAANE